MATNLDVSLVIRAIDRASAPMRRVTNNFQAMAQAKASADRSFAKAANIRQAGEGVAVFADKARRALAAPIAAFDEFQAAIAELRGVSQLGARDMARLEQEALRLGTSVGEFDPTGAAKGMTGLSRAGFKTQQIMDTLPSLLDLSTTANIDLAEATSIVTGVMGGFGIQAEGANRVTDILTATANNSKTTVQTLGQTFEYLAPVAAKAGLSLEQAAVLTGALGNASIDASRAGTSLTAAILRLAGARRGPGSKILAEMGIQLDEVVDGVERARDPLKVFADIGANLAGRGLNQRQQIGALGRIFGSEAAPGAAILATALKDVRTQTLATAVATADARDITEKTADEFRKTAENETKQVTSALNTLGIEIGRNLAPAISQLKMTILSMVTSITEWVKENPRLTKAIGLAALGVTALATALSGLLFTMAAFHSALGVAKLGLGGWKTALQLATAGVKSAAAQFVLWETVSSRSGAMMMKNERGIVTLAKSLFTKGIPAMLAWTASAWSAAAGVIAATWPVIAIAAAIAALIAGVVLIYRHWDRLVAIWERFKNASIQTKVALGLLLAPVLVLLSPLIAIVGIIKWFQSNGSGAVAALVAPFVWLRDTIKDIVTWLDQIQVPEPLRKFGEAHMKVWDAVKGAVTDTARESAFVLTGEDRFRDPQTRAFLGRTDEASMERQMGGGKSLVEIQVRGPADITNAEAEGVDLDIESGLQAVPVAG